MPFLPTPYPNDDPEDPDATWKAFMAERAETFRGLVGMELDDWAEEEVHGSANENSTPNSEKEMV